MITNIGQRLLAEAAAFGTDETVIDDLFIILDENNEANGMCSFAELAGEIEAIVKSGKIARVRAGTQKDIDEAFGEDY